MINTEYIEHFCMLTHYYFLCPYYYLFWTLGTYNPEGV